MGKYTARTMSASDLAAALKFIKTRNDELIKLVGGDATARALLNGCQIIEARAKEILTEKGHVVTGTLRRSINSQVRKRFFGIEGEVGSFIHYAPYVEALPDGGYLNPAMEEKNQEVADHLEEKGIKLVLRRWAR